MRRLMHNVLRSEVPRRCLALFAVFLFFMGSLGVLPSPAIFLATRTSERYPCESCGCGCASAQECWTRCCCHTMPERLAWAARNRVEVPSFVRLSPAELRLAEFLASQEQQAPAESCSLCHADPQLSSTSESVPPRPVITSVSPLKCKGITPLIAFAVVPAIHPRPVALPTPVLIGFLPRAGDLFAESITLDIEAPPPRRSAAV